MVRFEIRLSFARSKDALIFSTGSEEIYVEIMGYYFTKLLQTRTYNALHTSAALQKLFTCERLSTLTRDRVTAHPDGPTSRQKTTRIDPFIRCVSTFCGTTEGTYVVVARNIRRTLFSFVLQRAFS